MQRRAWPQACRCCWYALEDASGRAGWRENREKRKTWREEVAMQVSLACRQHEVDQVHVHVPLADRANRDVVCKPRRSDACSGSRDAHVTSVHGCLPLAASSCTSLLFTPASQHTLAGEMVGRMQPSPRTHHHTRRQTRTHRRPVWHIKTSTSLPLCSPASLDYC